uniref:Uncharacterized protein n=1 Tax=Oncorhynchus kisutch TaxID=8019 RepID=A0A8C7MIE2_ONCKI
MLSLILSFSLSFSLSEDLSPRTMPQDYLVSITCCLQDARNFYCAALTKIPPKPGQIGRGKRGERRLSTKDFLNNHYNKLNKHF